MFGNLLKSAAAIAVSPVAVAADVITGGGIATDRDEPYTISAVKATVNNIGKAIDSLSED